MHGPLPLQTEILAASLFLVLLHIASLIDISVIIFVKKYSIDVDGICNVNKNFIGFLIRGVYSLIFF